MQEITISSALQFIILAGGAIATLGGGLIWLGKWLDSRIRKATEPIYKQLYPNGGNSIPDRITSLEQAFRETRATEQEHHRQNVDELEYLRKSHNAIRRALADYFRRVRAAANGGDPAAQVIEDRVFDELERLDAEFERRRGWRR